MGLRYDTEVATTHGWKPISEVGMREDNPTEAMIMTLIPKYLGKGVSAYFSKQVVFSLGQPWLKADQTVTYVPKHGDVIERCSADYGFDSRAWLSGVLFGIKHPGGAVKVPHRLIALKDRVRSYSTAWEERVEEPPRDSDAQVVGSFLSGWAETIMREGNQANLRRIRGRDKAHIDWFSEYAPFGGYMTTGSIVEDTQNGYSVAFRHYRKMAGWFVRDVEPIEIGDDPYYKLSSMTTLKGGICAISR